MHRTIWVVLALIAVSAVADVTIDPATGLWFPPYASPAEYLRRDPNHPYIRDVQRAFKEDPKLAAEVCAAVIAHPQAVPDPSMRQMRTMLDMTCVSLHAGARAKAADDERTTRENAALAAIFEQEETAAGAIPEAQRDAAAEALLEDVRNADHMLRPAFRGIALQPFLTFIPAELLSYHFEIQEGGRTFQPRDVATFVEELYRSRAASDRADANQWKRGLPAVLLFLGKIPDARKAAAAWLAQAPPENATYAAMMKAVADRASGDVAALRSITTNCRPGEVWRSQNPDSPPSDYCKESAAWLTIYALDAGGARAPRPLAEGAFELAATTKDDWPLRLRLIRSGIDVDPAGAERRFYDMLEEKNIPPGAELDAVYYLAKLAAKFDQANAASLYDCWLSLHGIQIPALPADAWSRLAAMPEKQAAEGGDCFGPGEQDVDSECVVFALQLREQAAIEAGQWDIAQQSVEKLLAVTLAGNGSPAVVRDALFNLASQEAEAGRKKEAGPIVAYLQSQPHDAYIGEQIGRLSALARDEHQPWAAPTLIDASRLSQRCPPPRPLTPRSAVQ